MSYPAISLKTPEAIFRDMLVETDSWRAFCASPDAVYADLAPTIQTGGVALGDAADKIVFGAFHEVEDHADFRTRPRISLRQLDDNSFNREGGFSFTGVIYAEIQLRVPTELNGRDGTAIHDGASKIHCLAGELLELTRQAGRLDIQQLDIGPAGIDEPTLNNGHQDRYIIGDFLIRCAGAT